MEEAANYSYEDLEVGKVVSFKKNLTQNEINDFAKIIGDYNPLHVDPNYASKTQFKKNIAHGMLVASYFSTLFGMVCPGKKNLFLSQSLNFKKPVFPNSEIIIKGEIKKKIDSIRALVIQTQIFVGEELVLDGEAMIKIIDLENE
ncbi:MAG: MaoC family dehydratase [archaeon]